MPELSIRFTSDETTSDAPIQVMLFRPDTGGSTAPVPFTPPLDDPELSELRWYLETYTAWPTGPDLIRAEGIEAQLKGWGQTLLATVTEERDAARVWQQFIDDRQDSKLLTIDATDPRVLRLPWELLADDGGHLFARRISVRRRLQNAVTLAADHTFELPVRVLVVVSRPEGSGFIAPRAVSRPLLDALDRLGEQVVTEFLYPPTLEALSERLDDASAPPVHVVHFDGHGMYDSAHGLGFLLFEDEKHQVALVDADSLGTLLSNCGIPLMVLNACQSAKQEEANPYASVAAQLIRSGVGSVLAMNYSVLVVAARKFVAAFYGNLAKGLSVGQAVDKARRALMADSKRHTLYRRDDDGNVVETTIKLKDWFLPALYQQADDPVVFAQDGGTLPAAKPVPRALTDPSFPGGLPAEPLHGFHGRARELLNLERRLADHAVVVVHGFGGLGKTTLAAEAGRWFHRTGRFPGGAAFVSVEHGGSLQQLCSWVGQAVSGDPDFTLGAGDPVERVATLLRERPALVILDNFESVLGADPLMPAEELQEVLDAVWTWGQAGLRSGTSVTGSWGSRILITTRDTHFNDMRFSPSQHCAHLPLDGLALLDARELAANVLDAYGIDRDLVNRQDLERLLINLGGHPLSLNLVLPHLREHTATELIARFEELLPGFTQGQAQERNESLEISLEFSLRRLGEDTRAALPALAVFQGGCMEHDLLAITEMDETVWAAARAELEAAALVTVETIPGVSAPFLQFHPTLLPYLARLLPAEQRAALEMRYWQRYHAAANFLYRTDTQHPHEARAIAMRELPNLMHAFGLALVAVQVGTAEVLVAVDFANRITRFLDNFGRWRERDALLARVENLDVADDDGRLTKAEYLQQSGRGYALLQAGRVAEAEATFQTLLAQMETGMAYEGIEADYDRALTLRDLGLSLAARGLPSQAIQRHQAARDIFAHLSASGNQTAKQMLGAIYADLGNNLRSTGQFDAARQAYESGLVISREVDDKQSVGVILGQLGRLAYEQNDLEEAQKRHVEALNYFQTLGEPLQEAKAWHLLGSVFLEKSEWEKADLHYRQAIRLYESIGLSPELAMSYHQLALVAHGAGRFDDTERWLLRAQEIKDQVAPHDASTLNNLAILYLDLGRLGEARQYAERAIVIMETLDLSAEPWKTYGILAQIAERQGHSAEAAAYRRKEQVTFAAFPGAIHQIHQFNNLIMAVVRAVEGDAESMAFVNGEYPKMETAGEEWQQTAVSIRRVIEGERDINTLCDNLDREKAYIIRRILAGIAGEDPLPAATPPTASAPAQDPVARIRSEWDDVIQAVIAACQGNTDAAAQLAPFLDEMGQQDDWRALIAVLRRILAGERDTDTLLVGLDATDTVVAGDVLRGLGVDVPEPQLTAALPMGAAPDDHVQEILQNFQPVIAAVVATVQGNAQARAEVEGLFDTLTENGWQIVEPIQRIWAGERDPNALTAGIDDNSAIIVQAILAVLSEDMTPDAAPAVPPADDSPQGEAVSLDQLLDMVKLAASPVAPPGLSRVLHMSTQQMMNDPNAPAEFRALGRVINAIVSGDRNPDLSALPEELAAPVRQLLASLG